MLGAFVCALLAGEVFPDELPFVDAFDGEELEADVALELELELEFELELELEFELELALELACVDVLELLVDDDCPPLPIPNVTATTPAIPAAAMMPATG